MTESLKDVIAKLKSQQNSQVSQKPIEAVKPAPAPSPIEDEDEFIEDEVEQTKEVPKADPKIDPKEQAKIEQILEEMELLNNNGRFRVELLHQMQEINQALVVIASAITSRNDKA